ncbi:hypothetical protein FJZ28_05245 [Candidatus Peregrinibacteria bacterium]|nr:hypothetical protein [Candidatus Peregrinibacteria bacterium]
MSPATDTHIAHRYTAKTLEKKGKNKTLLQGELGWGAEIRRPVLCLPAGMSDKLGGELFLQLLPGLLALPLEILVVGKGSSKFGSLFTDLSKEHRHRIAIISNEESALHKMYAAADMALFLSDPAGQNELSLCLEYGVVPVSIETKKLEDYNPVQESGNAFLFSTTDLWHAYAAVVRAVETFKFPYDWRTIQRHAMETMGDRSVTMDEE